MANCRDEFRVAAGRCLQRFAIVEDRRTNMLVDRDREVSEDIMRDAGARSGHRTINARGLGGLRLSRVTAGSTWRGMC